MSDYAIHVEHLGKLYRLGLKEEIHDTLVASIYSWVRTPLRNFQNLRKLNTFNAEGEGDDLLWALRNVSFDIRHGEVVGIIGRNGAGKSTLLKVLSRITEPTRGRVVINGRVASLLEVGTGFHPELSGRENVYMNGTILGMSKKEIDRKFDEIVDFSGIEKFIDTPIKRYSSGMKVRLAFSVAAHLEPEILIIDEVLAVGDADFQKKCLGKMDDVAKQGRTVLFVSHNMSAVQTLCSRGIFLQQGRVVIDDVIDKTMQIYLSSLEAESQGVSLEARERKGKGEVKLKDIKVFAPNNGSVHTLIAGQPASFRFDLTGFKPGLVFHYTIYDNLGQRIANFSSKQCGQDDVIDPQLGQTMICDFDVLMLRPGRYRLNTAIFSNSELQDHIEGACFFDVESGHYRGRPIDEGNSYGSVFMPHRWHLPS